MKAIVYAAIGLAFAWLFYERYWKWRDCIDPALSSCVTPEGDHLTGGGMFWGGFAILFFLMAIGNVIKVRMRR